MDEMQARQRSLGQTQRASPLSLLGQGPGIHLLQVMVDHSPLWGSWGWGRSEEFTGPLRCWHPRVGKCWEGACPATDLGLLRSRVTMGTNERALM